MSRPRIWTWPKQHDQIARVGGYVGKRISTNLRTRPTGTGLQQLTILKIPVYSGTPYLLPMDVNGDGQMDLVQGNYDPQSQKLNLYAWISDGQMFREESVNTTNVSRVDIIGLWPMDANGDGMSDLVEGWITDGIFLNLQILFADGTGGFTPGELVKTQFSAKTDSHFWSMDVNGDGTIDLVQALDNSEMGSLAVYLNRNLTFDQGTNVGSGLNDKWLNQVWPLDYTGDGKMDLVQTWGSSGPINITGLRSKGDRPDLIEGFTNSIGGKTTVSYKPLSDKMVYTPLATEALQAHLDSSPHPSAAPLLNYHYGSAPGQAPYQRVGGSTTMVVAQTSEQNDPKINRGTYSYDVVHTYAAGLKDLDGRGWLGFQQINRLDVSSGVGRTLIMNQLFPKTNTVAQIQQFCDPDTSSDPLCKTAAGRNASGTQNVSLSNTTIQYDVIQKDYQQSPPDATTYQVVRSQEQKDYFTYGHLDYSRTTTYHHDNWGNTIQVDDPGNLDTPGIKAVTSDDLYECSNFSNNTSSADSWWVGRLTDRKISRNSTCNQFDTFDAKNDFRLEHWDYDDRGNQTSYGIYDDGNDVTLTVTYEPDGFGNIIRKTLPGGGTETTVIDPEYHTYVDSRTTAPNLNGTTATRSLAFDPRFGVQVAERSHNGQVGIWCLDPLGRVHSQQGPVPEKPSGVLADKNCLGTAVTGGNSDPYRQAAVVTLVTFSHVQDGDNSQFDARALLQNWPTSQSPAQWRQFRTYYDGKYRTYLTLAQAGKNTEVGDSGWEVACGAYDSRNNPVATTLPMFVADNKIPACTPTAVTGNPLVDTATFDAYSRPTRRVMPMDNDQTTTTQLTYPSRIQANTTLGSNTGDAYETQKTFDYFAGQRKITELVVPKNGNATTSYHYDPIGRLLQVVSPTDPTTGNVVVNTLTYDSVSRRTSIDNPDQNTTGDPGIKALTLTYDGNSGLLKTATDALKRTTTYEYDARGRNTRKIFSDQTTVTFGYDTTGPGNDNGVGQLTSETGENADGSIIYAYTYGYDAYGHRAGKQLSVSQDPPLGTYNEALIFNPLGQIIGQTFPDSSKYGFTYDMGNMSQLFVDDGNQTPLATFDQYTPFGAPQTWTYANKVSGTRSYNAVGMWNGRTSRTADGTKVADLSLKWNSLQLLQETIDNLAAPVSSSQTFDYRFKRLTAASAAGLYGTKSYGYDLLGNLISQDGQAINYEAHRPKTGHTADGTAFSADYDPTGAMTARTYGDDRTNFAYDARGRLTRVSQAGSGTTLLSIPIYDDTGRRLLRQADGTRHIFMGSGFQETVNADGGKSSTGFLNGPLGTVAAFTNNGINDTIRYFDDDHLGSTMMTFDEQGRVLSKRAYLPYGATVATASNGGQPLDPQFQGKILDTESALYYFGARYYDPVLGRFITPDNRLGSHLYSQDTLNRYAFALNSPTTFIDPSGHSIWDAIAGISIGVVEVAAGVAVDVVSEGSLEEVGGGLIGAGTSGITYGAFHTNNFSWKQYALGEAQGAITGMLTAGVGDAAQPAEEAAEGAGESAGESAGEDSGESAGSPASGPTWGSASKKALKGVAKSLLKAELKKLLHKALNAVGLGGGNSDESDSGGAGRKPGSERTTRSEDRRPMQSPVASAGNVSSYQPLAMRGNGGHHPAVMAKCRAHAAHRGALGTISTRSGLHRALKAPNIFTGSDTGAAIRLRGPGDYCQAGKSGHGNPSGSSGGTQVWFGIVSAATH